MRTPLASYPNLNPNKTEWFSGTTFGKNSVSKSHQIYYMICFIFKQTVLNISERANGYIYLIPLLQAGSETRSIFMQSKAGFYSE